MQVRFSGLFARVAGRQRNMLAGIDDSADARVSRLRAVTSVGCRRPVLGKPEELVCDREVCGLTDTVLSVHGWLKLGVSTTSRDVRNDVSDRSGT
jgi:hypothetical protein